MAADPPAVSSFAATLAAAGFSTISTHVAAGLGVAPDHTGAEPAERILATQRARGERRHSIAEPAARRARGFSWIRRATDRLRASGASGAMPLGAAAASVDGEPAPTPPPSGLVVTVANAVIQPDMTRPYTIYVVSVRPDGEDEESARVVFRTHREFEQLRSSLIAFQRERRCGWEQGSRPPLDFSHRLFPPRAPHLLLAASDSPDAHAALGAECREAAHTLQDFLQAALEMFGIGDSCSLLSHFFDIFAEDPDAEELRDVTARSRRRTMAIPTAAAPARPIPLLSPSASASHLLLARPPPPPQQQQQQQQPSSRNETPPAWTSRPLQRVDTERDSLTSIGHSDTLARGLRDAPHVLATSTSGGGVDEDEEDEDVYTIAEDETLELEVGPRAVMVGAEGGQLSPPADAVQPRALPGRTLSRLHSAIGLAMDDVRHIRDGRPAVAQSSPSAPERPSEPVGSQGADEDRAVVAGKKKEEEEEEEQEEGDDKATRQRKRIRPFLLALRLVVKMRNMTKQEATMKDFEPVTLLGAGGFARVYLCRVRSTGEIVAIKKIRQDKLTKKNQVATIQKERHVLVLGSTSPWMVGLFAFFHDAHHLYLAMEFVPGGDFRAILNVVGCLTVDDARFYVTEMLLAARELHRFGYIHRDLKPENFLIDATGHVKLSDFGLSRMSVEHTPPGVDVDLTAGVSASGSGPDASVPAPATRAAAMSVVGSPFYMAPEIVARSRYTETVDWWSIGCILYEMICGCPPFCADTPADVMRLILHHRRTLIRPTMSSITRAFDGDDDLSIPLSMPSAEVPPEQPEQPPPDAEREAAGPSPPRAVRFAPAASSAAAPPPQLTTEPPHPGEGGDSDGEPEGDDTGDEEAPPVTLMRRARSHVERGKPGASRRATSKVAGLSKLGDAPPALVRSASQQRRENARRTDELAVMDDVTWDFLSHLLCEPDRRFSTWADIAAHPFLSGVPWAHLRDRPPPFVPDLESDTDTSYFNDAPHDPSGWDDDDE